MKKQYHFDNPGLAADQQKEDNFPVLIKIYGTFYGFYK
jgi:hypothetical protein